MFRGLERPPFWAIAAIVVSLIAIGIMIPIAMRRGVVPAGGNAATEASTSAEASASASASATAPAARVDIAVLGDSYTAGSPMDSGEKAEWPALLTAGRPWNVTRSAAAGAGFLAGRDAGIDFAARVPGIVAAKPDVVVVAGGYEDARFSLPQATEAARSVLSALRAGLPDAKIVVLGVLWPAAAPAGVFAFDDALKAASADVGAVFVDALREGWLSGGNSRLIGSDGVHPTDEGHAALAQRIGAALIAAGVPVTV